MKTLTHLIISALVAVSILAAAPASAQPVVPDPDTVLSDFAARADGIGQAIEKDTLEARALEEVRWELETRRKDLADIAAAAKTALEPLQTRMEALGPAPEGTEEPAEIAEQRAALQAEIDETDALRKRAEEAATRAAALLEQLTEIQRRRFQRALLQRGPSPLSPDAYGPAWTSITRGVSAVEIEVRNRLSVGGAVQSLLERLALPAILALFGLFLAVAARRWMVARIQRVATADTPKLRQIGLASGLTLARLLLPGVAVGLILLAASLSGLAGPTGITLLKAIGQGALVVIGAYALGGAFFAPGAPSVRLSALGDADARRAHRWLIALAVVIAADRVLIHAGREIGLTINALALMNAGLLVLGGLALWRFVQVSRIGKAEQPEENAADPEAEDPPEREQGAFLLIGRIARILMRVAAVAAPLLALAGYYAASRFVFYPVVFSGAVIGVCLLLQMAARELAQAGGARQGTEGTAEADRTGFLPVMAGFLLTLAATPVLALIWGASVTDLETAWHRLIEGFTVGEVTLAPVDFIVFAIVFSIGYLLTRALKGVLRRSVMPLMRMDEGAKSAMLAGVGYVGVTISALVAISTTALDLSNLAIVAGALSVGIGFGLQNIVNNFVSGIILLIERPIKTGDWVEIGGVHGTVRQVNVRSTEIQTFDRSTMFVPNADLISGTVTNWTHGDSLGRLIVPVGVAYGSDVRKVEKILLEVAQAHPMLTRRPAPYVIFTGFGADSLDFEIRGVLRDVNWILNVASDIRFSIYERFTEAGIEIPFAQRDVHIKSLGGLEKLIGQRPEGGGEEEFPDLDADTGPDGAPPGEGPDAE